MLPIPTELLKRYGWQPWQPWSTVEWCCHRVEDSPGLDANGRRPENPQQAKVCLECGARLTLTRSKGRAELRGSAKFCLECG
jgi:hypothetical protein